MNPDQNQQSPNPAPAYPPPAPVPPDTPPPPQTGGTNQSVSPKTPSVVYIGLIFTFIIPLVGLVLSIIAWRKVAKEHAGGKKIAIISTFVAAIFLIINLLFLGLILMLAGGFHAFSGNGAEKAAKPIASGITQLGGKKLCSNGDSGYGIDNTTPWYQAYYQVPNSPDLTNKVTAIASQAGYTLGNDTEFINQLQGKPDSDGSYSTPYGDEEFNPKSNYLNGQNGGNSLKMTVNRQTSVALYCGVGDYGKKQPTGNDAIIDFTVTLPDTNR